LIAFDGVPVGEKIRAVAIEDEQVGVATEGEGGFGILAERLANGAKPSPGTLPGVVGAVELLGAEGAVIVGEGDGRGSERTG
jgi:hypothetical protein